VQQFMKALFKGSAGMSTPAIYAGGMNEKIRVIRRRELFEQQSRLEGLAVQGAETAHHPKVLFSAKCMGERVRRRLARQALGNQFQEPV
jgi:hypothetical protein